jgi:hypothetical protein
LQLDLAERGEAAVDGANYPAALFDIEPALWRMPDIVMHFDVSATDRHTRAVTNLIQIKV